VQQIYDTTATSIPTNASVQIPHWTRLLQKFVDRTAQNPVIRLWTACTRLKNQYLQIRIFH
jgi:hypothetical protein